MKYAILGAGPSGLTMGMFLKHPYQIFEKENHPGGHASSKVSDGYTFDTGPHIMFSKNKEILNFMIKSLGKNIQRCRRNNKISYRGSLVKYPFENDLKSLPLEDNFDCLKSFIFNNYKKKYPRPRNLKQWLLNKFGLEICRKYLFPYNEKIWNIPVEKLSMSWSKRIPVPSSNDIIKSSIGFETEGYLHQLYYHYPLRGGYQAISNNWSGLVNVKYNFMVKSIKKSPDGKFIISNGKEFLTFDKIISTIPIHDLIKILDIKIPRRVTAAVKSLIINPMFAVCLGIKGKDPNQFTAIYFPDSDFLVNRISFPKTFSPFNAPRGYYSIQAEITCTADSHIWKKTDPTILNHVINGLIKRSFIKSKKDIYYKHVIRSRNAYVVYDLNYEKNTKIIRDWFPRQGIHLVGRFSYFEYINVDMVIDRSMKVASLINGSPVNLNNIYESK